jgi:predicted SAM-dependent methyltransferase
MKLHLGCGFKHYQDMINIDGDYRCRPDIVRDIERGLPFADNSVDYILTEHTLEHVNHDMIHFVMFEIWRVLKHKGQVEIVVPIGKGWTNSPEHKTPFDYRSELFFTVWNLREPYKFNLVFKEIRGEDITEELHFILEALKGGQQ